jgi:hypothetical protein
MKDIEEPSCLLCGIWSSRLCPPILLSSPLFGKTSSVSDLIAYSNSKPKRTGLMGDVQKQFEQVRIVDSDDSMMIQLNIDEADFIIKTNIWSDKKPEKCISTQASSKGKKSTQFLHAYDENKVISIHLVELNVVN